MAGISDIRRENLRAIVDERFGGDVKALAELMGKQESQIRRHIPKRGGEARSIGTNLARQFEKYLKLPDGWMDHRHLQYQTQGHGNDIQVLGEPENIYQAMTEAGALLADIMAAIKDEYPADLPNRHEVIAKHALIVYDLLEQEEGPFTQREILLTWKACKEVQHEKDKAKIKPAPKSRQ